MPVLIGNGEGEAYTLAQVVFASPFGNWTGILPVGITQYVNLPCDVYGTTYITATAGTSNAPQISIKILPAPSCANPCVDPCANLLGNYYPDPCIDPCANPRPKSSRYSKQRYSNKNCRLYSGEFAEADQSISHLDDENVIILGNKEDAQILEITQEEN